VQGTQHTRGREDVFTGFWSGDPKGRDHWDDNIKKDFRETGTNGANWTHLSEGRVQW
jgi:hypothetical protein